MNKKQFNEMVAMKQKLEGKITALAEAKRRSSLSYLIESELEKAEVVLATKAIVDKIGKMAEDMLSIEGDDLMPMIDSLKAAYGPQMAEAFQSACTECVRSAVASLTHTKDAVSAEVSKLEGVFNGEAPANDMATADFADEPAADAFDPLESPGMDDTSDAVSDMAPDRGTDDVSTDDIGGLPLGRARKESVERKGKALNEGLLTSIKEILTAHFDDVTADRSAREQLEALKPFVNAADYEIASQFPDQLLKVIFDRGDVAPIGDVMPEIENPVVHHDVPAIIPSVPMAVPGDDMMSADLDGDMMDDEFDDDLASDMDEPIDTMAFESIGAKRLRESKNPDAMILGVYKHVIKEGVSKKIAVAKVAEAFSIEKNDVLSIVREAEEAECKAKVDAAEAAKPGKDWNKLYNGIKGDDMTIAAMAAHICDNSKDKCDKKAVTAWLKEKTKKIDEAEGDVGFNSVSKAKYPKPTVTAIATKSGSKDASSKSPVVASSKKKVSEAGITPGGNAAQGQVTGAPMAPKSYPSAPTPPKPPQAPQAPTPPKPPQAPQTAAQAPVNKPTAGTVPSQPPVSQPQTAAANPADVATATQIATKMKASPTTSSDPAAMDTAIQQTATSMGKTNNSDAVNDLVKQQLGVQESATTMRRTKVK